MFYMVCVVFLFLNYMEIKEFGPHLKGLLWKVNKLMSPQWKVIHNGIWLPT